MHYDLPKKYISYSAFSLWQKDKEAFRRRYYLNEPAFENAETIFGKEVHRILEKSSVGAETHIEVELEEGLKLLGYLDSFCKDTLKIIDHKTGHLDSKGRVPWDKIKVQKHKQLVFYSLLVQLKHDKFNPSVELHWYETRFKNKTTEFDGHVLETESRDLELTGRVEVFKRKVYKWEIEKLKQEIKNVAVEISEDYQKFKLKNI